MRPSAQEDCENMGGRLAIIEDEGDLRAIRDLLSNVFMTSVWIGADYDRQDPHCSPDNLACWKWMPEKKVINPKITPWSVNTEKGPEPGVDAVVFDVNDGNLSFLNRLNPRPSICEMAVSLSF